MRLYCPEGDGHVVMVRFQPSAGERFCPEHGRHLLSADFSKPRSGLSRASKPTETPEHRRARDAFERAVCAYPCFFQRNREGHVCSFPLDAHHLIPKQFIKQRLDLPEDELLAILFHPLIGAPLCRAAHDAVERGTDRIYWDELSPECIQFASPPSLPEFMALRLEKECPKREAVR